MAKKKPEYEPGLGCPHCKWAGYTFADRTKHITKKHPGEYAGASPDMLGVTAAIRSRGGDIPDKLTPFEERGVSGIFNDRRQK